MTLKSTQFAIKPTASRRWAWLLLGAVGAALLGAVVFWLSLPKTPTPNGHDEPTWATAPSVPDGPDWFRDVTADSGIDFTYRNGEEADEFTILESIGGGVALLDYDGDGLLDVFFTGGGYFEGHQIKGYPCRLYKNLGNWKFRDVTAAVGLDKIDFYTHGCAVADYNRDGWPDLLITGYGRVALFRNDAQDGGRRFVDVTDKAACTTLPGLPAPVGPTSPAAAFPICTSVITSTGRSPTIRPARATIPPSSATSVRRSASNRSSTLCITTTATARSAT